MNTLDVEGVLKYKHRITDLLIPLNELIQEAYEAGIKDIEVFVEREHLTPGRFPMISICCSKKGS